MPDHITPAPEPETALGRYRVLSPKAAVRVSPLQLGAMSLGEAWGEFMGEFFSLTLASLCRACEY